MIIKFFKNNLSKEKLGDLFAGLKTTRFLGEFSIILAIAIAAYAFTDLDVAVKRGPLLVKIFGTEEQRKERLESKQLAQLQAAVLPEGGIVLPVKWGDLGNKLVESGVIDGTKFEQLYASRGGLSDEDKELLYGADNKNNLVVTAQNSGLLLNLLWALGLGNKNEILDNGEMTNYDGKEPVSRSEALAKAGGLASTGGWSLARGGAMGHYSMHHFIDLSPEQQELVARVSQNIYRPCCNNSTHFPDCNHGMAMLGLLELMAAQGVGERDMYKAALAVNSFWFPNNYLTIAKYLETKGFAWDKMEPKAILGANFSSGSGYQQIVAQVSPPVRQGGNGCGI